MSARDLIVPPVPPATKADLEALDEQLRQAFEPPVCAKCDRDLLPGDAIPLDGSTYCPSCALDRCAFILEDLLAPGYAPEELRARQYQQAREVMHLVLMRVDTRMREVGAARAS